MADYSNSEKQSIKDSVKSLKKYGSTCNHMKRSDYYVTHVVQKTDTLQGIALKYNTTTEQIRRVNRLFASDSLFLRDTLKIPVSKEVANSFESNNHLSSDPPSEAITSSFSSDSFTNEDEKSANDFLGKIDSSIANTRAQVRLVQAQSNFINSMDHITTGRKTRSSRDAYSSSNSNDVFVTPQAVVLNTGRKVKSSLQRLEKEQDELFEL
ncbi:UNVERIFIED_CONTAM: hypothetical protein PYX00_007349 [Menopon gallinae]|uniref:LysM domain-containing protein n=1 Tax=Menopon gallinae TaxID=328185 RepID=A0AAW2HIW8_9NEOP